jgi:hypothetical protein
LPKRFIEPSFGFGGNIGRICMRFRPDLGSATSSILSHIIDA